MFPFALRQGKQCKRMTIANRKARTYHKFSTTIPSLIHVPGQKLPGQMGPHSTARYNKVSPSLVVEYSSTDHAEDESRGKSGQDYSDMLSE